MHLPLLLLAYAAGLGCASYLTSSPLFLGAALASATLWLPLRNHRAAAVCLVAFFFFLGIVFYFQETQPPVQPTDVRSFVSEGPRVLQGEILSISGRPEGRTDIELAARRIVVDGKVGAVHGRVLLRVNRGEIAARTGDELRFRTRLRQPAVFATPGEFDYPRHLAARGIFVTAFVPESRELAVFPAAEETFHFAKLQHATARAIMAAVDPVTAPLVRALVTGDKGGITAEQRDLLARGGISHLFSISGLHLGLIALFLFLLARFFYCRSETLLLWAPAQRALPWLLLPALWFYLQLTGNALPTRRAFLMAVAGALLLLICRRTEPLKILAAAALLILLFTPLALFQPSFQLSFAGVFGILLLVSPWSDRLAAFPRAVRWFAALSLTTLAASLATTPFALLHFHLFAPAGLLTNIVAVPAVGFLAVPCGLLGAATNSWWPEVGAFFFRGCAAVIDIILTITARVTAFPPLAGSTFYFSPLQTGAVFFICGGLLLAGSLRAPRAAGALLLTGVLLMALPAAPVKGISVTSLSVGQGEATLVSLPPDRHYLIDGGGLYGSAFDIGERLIAPALGRLGVRRLEAVILTHDHPDHRQGLLHVLQHFPVGSFWTASAVEQLDPGLRQVIASNDIPVRTFPVGWNSIEETAQESFSLFVPKQRPEALNDSSLVARIGFGNDAVLLTGDLEAAGVAELLRTAPPAANLIKLPHHGSRRSQPELLFDYFRPQAAFVSVGANNAFRFPHSEVVAALAQRRIPLYRTDSDGTLRFHGEGQKWQVKRWRNGLFR
ncbi:MAG: DNA internalization-related competence protein ComEC/Rec2 [Desulfuromonadales bacterium]